MRVVAFLISLVVLTSACFPNNAKHRTIAKFVEGGVVIGGIGMLAVVNTKSDCQTEIPGEVDADCEAKAELLGNIGLGLIIAGLIGFIATVSTSPDDKPDSPPQDPVKTDPKPTPTPTPIATPPADPPPPTEPPPTEPAPPVEPTPPP